MAMPLLALAIVVQRLPAQDNVPNLSPQQQAALQKFSQYEWTKGPAKASIGTHAEIEIPEGMQFMGAEGAQALLELYGNPANPDILAAIVPTAEDQDWTVVFQFSNIGYVKDADKEKIDGAALLQQFKDSIPAQNEARRAIGGEEMTDITWAEPPFYDPQSNNLTWAMHLHFPSGDSINYDVRLLGRHGVMEATLIGDPATYKTAVPSVKTLLAGYTFKEGNRYGEWRQGDRVAAMGLTGLIAGGAAVAAVKTGLLSKLGLLLAKAGKAIILVVVFIGAAIVSVVKKIFGMGDRSANQ